MLPRSISLFSYRARLNEVRMPILLRCGSAKRALVPLHGEELLPDSSLNTEVSMGSFQLLFPNLGTRTCLEA